MPFASIPSFGRPRSLALFALAGIAFALVSCGDDDADAAEPTAVPEGSPAVSATAAGNSAVVHTDGTYEAPASRFAVSQDDLETGQFITMIRSTYIFDADTYSDAPIFDDHHAGMELLQSWGYLDGYETGYEPEGRGNAVLNGAEYVSVETHLFETEAGAEAAFEYFVSKLEQSGSTQVSAPSLGEASSAWRLVDGYVGSSSVHAAFHRVVMRRDNLVSVVMTWGAEPFMQLDDAIHYARIVEEKALGERPAVEPTPTSNYKPPDYDDGAE